MTQLPPFVQYEIAKLKAQLKAQEVYTEYMISYFEGAHCPVHVPRAQEDKHCLCHHVFNCASFVPEEQMPPPPPPFMNDNDVELINEKENKDGKPEDKSEEVTGSTQQPDKTEEASKNEEEEEKKEGGEVALGDFGVTATEPVMSKEDNEEVGKDQPQDDDERTTDDSNPTSTNSDSKDEGSDDSEGHDESKGENEDQIEDRDNDQTLHQRETKKQLPEDEEVRKAMASVKIGKSPSSSDTLSFQELVASTEAIRPKFSRTKSIQFLFKKALRPKSSKSKTIQFLFAGVN
ncbi:hypothetical protein BGZ49_003956 [Haplosporangium sp. Z 27]|nr:hypothetical protein BGZ49_003956 [Haplosporangium sp. Z 27]